MNLINKNEFETLCIMLNGINEDFELAVSNLINLNLNEIYYGLFLKELALDKRVLFYNKFSIHIDSIKGFHFQNLKSIEKLYFSKKIKFEKIITKYYNLPEVIDSFDYVYRTRIHDFTITEL